MDRLKLVQAVQLFLEGLGDVAPQLRAETPARVADAALELFDGLNRAKPQPAAYREGDRDLGTIVIAGLSVASTCEHHLLPFFGDAEVSYLPHDGRILGFGDVADVVAFHAHRLQLQERLTADIADHLHELLSPQWLVVRLRCMHLCTSLRGPKEREARVQTEQRRGQPPDAAC